MSKKSYSNFFTGALFGIGIGLLLAYNESKQAKQELKDKLNYLLELIDEIDVDEVKKVMETKVTELKNELESLDKETVLSLAKEKAEIIINKSEDLITLSKNANVAIVEKTANDIKKATMNTLETILLRIDEKAEILEKEAKIDKSTKTNVNVKNKRKK